MTPPQFNPDHLQIHYCGIISFEVQNDEDVPLRPNDIDQHQFTIQSKLSVGEGNWLRVLLKIDCEAQTKEKDRVPLKGAITTECLFQIEGLDDLVRTKKEPIPHLMGVTAVSIAYSTTRGLLASRVSGTFLEGAVLPIVQPTKLLAPEQPVLRNLRFSF